MGLLGLAMEAAAQDVATIQFASDTLTYPEASGSGSTPVLQTGVTIWETTGTLTGFPSFLLRGTDGTAKRGTDYNLGSNRYNLREYAHYDTSFSFSSAGVWTYPNGDDGPDKQFTWKIQKYNSNDKRYNLGSRTTATVIIRDDDPTVV
ncbi:MAG: hypothetical protein F4025_08480, partial [Synechococcus sp. SB0669_bin_7]|nr:hypothetical protein [Synechococcus sp. SB0669_bin_7]